MVHVSWQMRASRQMNPSSGGGHSVGGLHTMIGAGRHDSPKPQPLVGQASLAGTQAKAPEDPPELDEPDPEQAAAINASARTGRGRRCHRIRGRTLRHPGN